MSESGVIALFVCAIGAIGVVARALYHHVVECRRMREQVNRIMDFLGLSKEP